MVMKPRFAKTTFTSRPSLVQKAMQNQARGRGFTANTKKTDEPNVSKTTDLTGKSFLTKKTKDLFKTNSAFDYNEVYKKGFVDEIMKIADGMDDLEKEAFLSALFGPSKADSAARRRRFLQRRSARQALRTGQKLDGSATGLGSTTQRMTRGDQGRFDRFANRRLGSPLAQSYNPSVGASLKRSNKLVGENYSAARQRIRDRKAARAGFGQSYSNKMSIPTGQTKRTTGALANLFGSGSQDVGPISHGSGVA